MVRVKPRGNESPQEPTQEGAVNAPQTDGHCKDDGGNAGEVSLRLLTQQEHEGKNVAGPLADRSRLILVMNEKTALLADLISCTEELAELYEREGCIDKQIREMEDLCTFYSFKYGESHHRTMDMLHRTARRCAMAGEYDEALQLLQKLYPLRIEVSGRKDEKTLKCYALRAVVFEELGRHVWAMQSLTELRAFGSDVLPELVRVTKEECEEIYKAKRKEKKT